MKMFGFWGRRSIALNFTLIFLAMATMRRPLWEKHPIRWPGLMRGSLFGILSVLVGLTICVLILGAIQFFAPISETPRPYLLLYRSGLFAVALVCLAPGFFALVVCVRERQGYSTIGRIWRIDRAQTLRGIFLIAVLTACVGGVAFVGASRSRRGIEAVVSYLGGDIDWINSDDDRRRVTVSSLFTIIAFTTAHVVQYERIRDWESGGDVTGVFD
jgi:hypothetical protein